MRMTPVVGSIFLSAAVLAGCSSGPLAMGHRNLRVVTFNIHRAEGPDGKVDIERIADVINGADADIVALQGADRWVPRSGKVDMMSRLSDLTGMTYAFCREADLDGGVTGNGVLTRFPILEEKSPALDESGSVPDRMMELVLDVHGIELVVLNAQFRQDIRDSTRAVFAERIVAEVRGRGFVPVVVCGTFDADPADHSLRTLAAELEDSWKTAGTGEGYTYPSAAPRRRTDFIFTSRVPAPTDSKTGRTSLKAGTAKVITTDASSHLPVAVDFKTVSE